MFYIDNTLTGFLNFKIVERDIASFNIDNTHNSFILIFKNKETTITTNILSNGFSCFIMFEEDYKLELVSTLPIVYNYSLSSYSFYSLLCVNNKIFIRSLCTDNAIKSIASSQLLNTDYLEEGTNNLYITTERLLDFKERYLKNTDFLPEGSSNKYHDLNGINCNSKVLTLYENTNNSIKEANLLLTAARNLASIIKTENTNFTRENSNLLTITCPTWYDPTTLNYTNNPNESFLSNNGYPRTILNWINITNIELLEDGITRRVTISVDTSKINPNQVVIDFGTNEITLPHFFLTKPAGNIWQIENNRSGEMTVYTLPIKGISYSIYINFTYEFPINNRLIYYYYNYTYYSSSNVTTIPSFELPELIEYTIQRELWLRGTCTVFERYYKLIIHINNNLYDFYYTIYLNNTNWEFKLPSIFQVGDYKLTIGYYYQDRLLFAENNYELSISMPVYSTLPFTLFDITEIVYFPLTQTDTYSVLRIKGTCDAYVINSQLFHLYTQGKHYWDLPYKPINLGKGIKYSIENELVVINEEFEEVSHKYIGNGVTPISFPEIVEGTSFGISYTPYNGRHTFEIEFNTNTTKLLMKNINLLSFYYEIQEGNFNNVYQITIELDLTKYTVPVTLEPNTQDVKIDYLKIRY